MVGTNAPTLLMSAPVTTIVSWKGIPGNEGDLYSTAGARWYFASPGKTPDVVTVPADAWARRRLVACVAWPGASCLYEVP